MLKPRVWVLTLPSFGKSVDAEFAFGVDIVPSVPSSAGKIGEHDGGAALEDRFLAERGYCHKDGGVVGVDRRAFSSLDGIKESVYDKGVHTAVIIGLFEVLPQGVLIPFGIFARITPDFAGFAFEFLMDPSI